MEKRMSWDDVTELGRALSLDLGRYPADYIEAHIETAEATHITYRAYQPEVATSAISTGGNVRALVNGAWGFACGNELSSIYPAIGRAITQAELINGGDARLASAEGYVDQVVLARGHDPRLVPFADKIALLAEYNEIIRRTPGLKTAVVSYSDSYQRRVFANSAGSFIDQERADITLRISAVAAKDGEVQQANLSLGSAGDWKAISNLHQEVASTAQKAALLLEAPQAQGGEYTVVLDPLLAGVFTHEAFGHLSEADHVYDNDELRQMMQIGRVFGREDVNIVDDATLPALRGSYKYDDEGIPSRKVYLIKEGRLVGRLHSRETAAAMGEQLTGNARAVSYQFPPIVRMSNTFLEPGHSSFEDIIADIDDGIYAKGWYGGTTSMEMFTFSAGEAYRIRKGKITELLRPVVLTGNVFTTLKNITAIGSDLHMNQGGGCGKGGQFPLPVSDGSPYIRIEKCLVGGQ